MLPWLLCFLSNCCCSNSRATGKASSNKDGSRSVFSWRGWGLQCFNFGLLALPKPPTMLGCFYLNGHVGRLVTNSSAVHGCVCEIVTLVFPLHSCPTCCWTPPAQTQRLACTPCSSEKALRSTPNQSRKSSKGTLTHKDIVLVATWSSVHLFWSIFSCQYCHLVINFGCVSKKLSTSPFQVQLRGQVRLRQALPGPGLLRPCSHAHFLQRDSGGCAKLHLEEL